ncbi:outer membrane protein assembly factor [bacterium]|nr:MAG: outer membrane protein assembly factor [bacterium]
MKKVGISCFYVFILLIWGISSDVVSAQQKADSSLFVKQVRITGNDEISTSVLETIIRTKTNREFLNIPNFRPWYWLWVLTKSVGEAPYPLVRETISADIDRIKTYYESQGFLDTRVDTSVIQYNKTDVEVSFIIEEGRSTTIKSIAYDGLNLFSDKERQKRFLLQSDLTNKALSDTLFSSGKKFNYERINLERNRIIDALKNNGYAAVTKDSVRFLIKRDTIDTQFLDILVLIKQGRVYHFGDAHIVVTGPEGQTDYSEKLTLNTEEHTVDSAKILISKSPSTETDFEILYKQLKFKPGDVFNNSLYLRSVSNLQQLGIANLRRFSLSADGGLANFNNPTLPVFVDLQTVPRNTINFNVFGFQRFGLGAGTGITYLNRNLFGSAEQLEVGVKGSFEYAQLDNNEKLLLSSEATISYAVPGLNFPFSGLNKNPLFENSRTIYLLRAAQINQFNYDIKANFGFNLKYEANHTQKLSSVFDFFEIDWVDAEATSSFINEVNNNPNLTPLQKSLILQDFNPQINSQIRYTIRDLNTDIIKHDRGYYLESSIELGGTLPYLADRFIFDPETVDNTIPSLGNTKLRYDQFVKISLDYRRYVPINDGSIFMYRGYAGYALPFGGSTSIPLIRRFFAGGAADIRGWAPATLGPGPVQDNTSQTNGGEIKLAAFAELRQEIFQSLFSANWQLGFFVDAGNIWNGPSNPNTETRFRFTNVLAETAVGTGLGIRIDWNYVIVRIDGAFRAHEPVRSGFFNDKQLYWFFGIGHAF